MQLRIGLGILVPDIPFEYSDHPMENKYHCKNGGGVENGASWF